MIEWQMLKQRPYVHDIFLAYGCTFLIFKEDCLPLKKIFLPLLRTIVALSFYRKVVVNLCYVAILKKRFYFIKEQEAVQVI